MSIVDVANLPFYQFVSAEQLRADLRLHPRPQVEDVRPTYYVRAWNRAIDRWFLMGSDKSPYARSLRKFRKKLRFNLLAGTFKPNLFLTLTLDRDHFENILAKNEPVCVSSMVRQFFKKLHQVDCPIVAYAWRIECGTQGTRRPHVHMLLQLSKKPRTKLSPLYNPVTGQYSVEERWTYHRCWPGGKRTDAKILTDDGVSHAMIANYITKYFSKNSKDGEDEPDSIRWAGQRFNTSRNLIKPPKSTFDKPHEFQNEDFAHNAIEWNLWTGWCELCSHSQEREPKFWEIDLKQPYKRYQAYMHVEYWFEGDEPGTQMRDYVFEQQKLRQQKDEARQNELQRKRNLRYNLAHPQPIDSRPFDELWAEYESNFTLKG